MTTSHGVVLSKVGGRYRIWQDDSHIVEGSLRGRFKQPERDQVLVGDRVAVRQHDDGGVTIEEVAARRSVLKRRTPGRSRGVRYVAANVDRVVVVGAVRAPDWDFHMIDRFAAVAEANGIHPAVVVNKCDLTDDPEACAHPYRRAGYDTLLTSVPHQRGIRELRKYLGGHTSLFTGPTGVGKSSLLNRLQPGLQLRTANVSRPTSAGRHTTVAAEMYALDDGGFVVDTPGLRDVSLWGLEPGDVTAAFPEFAEFAARCRFDNCRHLEEPDCAVVRAVNSRAIAASRLQSYRRLLGEALQASRPWSS